MTHIGWLVHGSHHPSPGSSIHDAGAHHPVPQGAGLFGHPAAGLRAPLGPANDPRSKPGGGGDGLLNIALREML